MAIEVMLDLETLGMGDNAVILSIGAVKFDPWGDGFPPDPPFEVFIDPKSCTDAGLVIDAATVMWWMHPDRAAAREVFVGKQLEHISVALNMFSVWVGQPKPVWGNGSDFDNVVLRNAYTKLGLLTPWKYTQNRCYRTISNTLPDAKWERVGTHHSAVDDAATQALHLQRILKGAKQ